MSSPESSKLSNRRDNLIKVAYFTGLAGMSMALGFSVSIGRLRKSTTETPDIALYEEGVVLARKALMKGTLYAVCGCTLFAVVSYKLIFKDLVNDYRADTDKRNKENTIDYEEVIQRYSK